MIKTKWNYAVMRNVFGNYWVGKTKQKTKKDIIFADIQEAIFKAEDLFRLDHGDEFDPDLLEDDENYDDNLLYEFEQISENAGDEEVKKSIEKFICK